MIARNDIGLILRIDNKLWQINGKKPATLKEKMNKGYV